MPSPISLVVLGATGAVGSNVVKAALASDRVSKVTTLGRRPLELPEAPAGKLVQHTVDVFDAQTYTALLMGHDAAVSTLGVGQPSKVTKDEFLRVDIGAPAAFAEAAFRQGIRHFSLMTSVGANPKSRVDYLRMKGELEARIASLGFERTSIFRPSMLLTLTNRYDFAQAVTLAVWPKIDWMFAGPIRKYRGIKVEELGRAIVANALRPATARVEVLEWKDFNLLGAPARPAGRERRP
jgi:uncharacterized protein YbjT (DUF2867 family)